MLFSFGLNAQMSINSNVTATQMISSLIGQGIAVSNVQLNCAQGSYGTFTNGATTNLGINSGIILTTGGADTAGSPNSTSGLDVSICVGTTTSDPDIIAIDPTATNDVCILEFDLIPKCDSLTIRFVFGSEEYPVFVNSINDLMAFFVTGPNPSGPAYASQNIAVIPGNIPVTINNINNGNTNTGPCVNCAYYINNSTGTTVQYNGMTVVITAGLGMVPCQTYHFKIAIADASDCALDSGVFIDFLSCATGFTNTSSSTPDVCSSCTGTATVNIAGGSPPYTYQWLPTGGNAATATGLCAGTYSCLVTDQNSCGIPDTIVVTVGSNGSVAASVAQVDATCFGACDGSLTVTPTSGNAPFTYLWSNGNTTNSVNGLCAGIYTVLVTDAGGCSVTNTYTIIQPSATSLALAGNNTICGGGSTTITATPSGGTGPYTVSWSNSLPNGLSQTVSPTTSTNYTATLTDANGCTSVQTFSVTVAPQPTAAFTAGPGDCAPATVTFTDNSTGGTQYVWDFGDPASGGQNISTSQNPSHDYSAAGTYDITLIVTNAGGCADTITMVGAVTISAQPVAGLAAVPETVSELFPEVIFNDLAIGGTNCVLYFGDGDSTTNCNFGSISHMYPNAGTFTAMYVVTNADGCNDTTYITITVEEQSTVYVPNAFTPNNMGGNEMFLAYGTNVKEFEMYVFDRWGMLIYKSVDIDLGWDGTYKNDPCQEDVYVYRIIWTDAQNKKHKLMGHVSLIR